MSDSLSQPDHIDEGRFRDASNYELVVKHSDWQDEKLLGHQLEEKLRSYAAFVRDGFLVRMKPEAENAAVWVVMVSETPLPENIRNVIDRVVSESSPHLQGWSESPQ